MRVVMTGRSSGYCGSKPKINCIPQVCYRSHALNVKNVANSTCKIVYTLWHNPGILPLLYTPLAVVGKLQGGADLMTPGLQRGPPFPAKTKKGAIVAIASLESPTIPMVVGTCEIDVSALGDVRGAKGHAVQTFHWAGDEIWSWSTSGKPGGDPPEYLEGWDDERKQDDNLAEQVDNLKLEGADEEEGGVSLGTDDIAERSQAEKSQGLEGEDAPSKKDFIDEVEDRELNTKGAVFFLNSRCCN